MVTIRRFRSNDLDAVLRLAGDYVAYDGTTAKASVSYSGLFPQGFLVAEEDGKVIGFVYAHLKDFPEEALKLWGAKKVGIIEMMAVDPAYRRKGIGLSLYDQVLKAFKQAGIDLIRLGVRATSEARYIYEKSGFKITGFVMERRV